jgi:hypothetical protein
VPCYATPESVASQGEIVFQRKSNEFVVIKENERKSNISTLPFKAPFSDKKTMMMMK